MKDNLLMREVKSSDIKESVSLHNTNHGDNRTQKHWLWEYKGNYPDNFVFVVLCEKTGKNKIVGTQGMIPVYLNIKGQKNLTGKSENTLISQEHRGGDNLFREFYDFAMAQCKERGMDCVWGLTALGKVWRKKLEFYVYDDAMYDSTLVLRFWDTFFELSKSKRTPTKKVTSPQKSRKKVGSLSFRLLLGYLKSSMSRIFSRKPKKRYSIEQNIRSIKNLDSLYRGLRNKYPNLIHLDLDKKYIRWRIDNNPFLNYRSYFIYEGNQLRAYCYFTTTDKKTAYIADLTFETPEAGSFLIQNLLSRLRKEKITHISFYGNIKNPHMADTLKLLKRFGFYNRPSEMVLVLQNINVEDGEHLLNEKNWYINGLWTEGARF